MSIKFNDSGERMKVYYLQCIFESDIIKRPYVMSVSKATEVLSTFISKKIYKFSRWELSFLESVLKKTKTDSNGSVYLTLSPLQTVYLESILQSIGEFLFSMKNNGLYESLYNLFLSESIEGRYVNVNYSDLNDPGVQDLLSIEDSLELEKDLEKLREMTDEELENEHFI